MHQKRGESVVPGLVVCLMVGLVAVAVQVVVPAVSPLLVAILLGVVVTNTVTVPQGWSPGIAVSGRRVLRIGIVLLGLQLSIPKILDLGVGVIWLAVAVVGLGLVGTLAIGRALHIPFHQRLLIASGFSICGAAAVAAVDSVVRPKEEDTATAIGLVVLFGTLSIPVVPLATAALGLDQLTAGLITGASVHEVAQVVASAGLVGVTALEVAVVVKLARVLLLAPVIAGISMWQRSNPAEGQGHRPPLVPLFVVGFLAAVALRSGMDLPSAVLHGAGLLQTFCLASAMFALGLGVRWSAFRRAGWAPLGLGLCSTLLVLGIAVGGTVLIR